MDSNARPRRAAALLLLFLSGLCAGPLWAHAINGAIYTSLAGGQTVNANNYASKDLVYLNGGPNNSQCNSGSLDAGEYYFQVTNPSGSVLLSSDDISERAFTVAGGVISAYAGSHATAVNTGPCGGISIQLMPYDDTPNNGGVYKVWITRTNDYFPDKGTFGFISGHTKTDNFRTQDRDDPPPPPDPTGNLEAFKFYDANANGLYDVGTDLNLENWPMTINPLGGSPEPATQLTNSGGTALWTGLAPDVYTVTEGEPTQSNWYNSVPGPNPTLLDPTDLTLIQQSTPVTAGEVSRVEFGNFCLAPSGGRTLGFWSNKNGQAMMNDGGTMAPELQMLRDLHLRTAAGGDFDPTTYSAFRTWILDANATNMAYMLSAQLAAMALNVEAGFVNPGSFYIPWGGTIGELITDANDLLGADGYTPSDDPNRSLQEELKNYLDQLNNGAPVVPAVPCAATF